MKEIVEKYYLADDGKKFNNEDECKEYENNISKLKELKTQVRDLNKEIACTEYVLYKKGSHIKSTNRSSGNGHDGYYDTCPHCAAKVGGYEKINTFFKVAESIYKCEKCGEFFKYVR